MEDLRSGIERLKQAKAHMREANGIMSDCISKLKELEEENAQLKAELGGLQIQPDASYMKLPLDAGGEPIHIGDVVYGNPGIAWTVVGLRVSPLGWKVQMDNMPFLCEPDDLTHKKPEPADSWEKLEEDARKSSCDYASAPLDENGLTTCNGCRFKNGGPCHLEKDIDLMKRAKKLAGIDEETQR